MRQTDDRAANEAKKPAPKRKTAWWKWVLTAVVVPVVAPPIGEGVKEITAHISPGSVLGSNVLGSYVMLAADDENKDNIDAGAINLKSHGTEVWGSALTEAKSWMYSGYMNSGYLVLAYRSKDPSAIGFGEYFLSAKDGKNAEYVGHMVGNFCRKSGLAPDRRIMRCNVVMVKGEMGGEAEKAARLAYKDYLGQLCVSVEEAVHVPAEKCGAGAH